MPDRRADGRARRLAWRLPAVLVSGLFMLVTAGLPASSTPTRDLTAEEKHQSSSGTELASGNEARQPATTAPPATPSDVAPPVPRSAVRPAPRASSPNQRGTNDVTPTTAIVVATHPDRGPPASRVQ